MKSRKILTSQLRRTSLAIGLGLCLAGPSVMAQSTTGNIFGKAPASSGETVVATSGSGITRQTQVDSSGNYSLSNLPLGNYTVSLQQNGHTIDSRSNVTLQPGAGTDVSFTSAASAANAQNLTGVTVSANALPAIDVTSVNSSTTITAADLKRLPLGRNAESIALLSPGTVAGSGYFGNAVSFGGAGVTENAYYVNGYNTTEPYRNTGGFQLPYGSIDQQQTLTGGYSAQYGRSDGGVINQIGKRGTNEWHFGGQVAWAPRFADYGPHNVYFQQQGFIPAGYAVNDDHAPGDLRQYKENNKSWETIYSAYFGGPLIKDKLFLFVSAETTKTKGNTAADVDTATQTYYTNNSMNFYGKIDWNINDSNILELTNLQNNTNNGYGSLYRYDNDTRSNAEFLQKNDVSKDSAEFWIAKYTSYITDEATLSVTWGKGSFEDPYVYANNSVNPYLSGVANQRPSDVAQYGGPVFNDNSTINAFSPGAGNSTRGLRADFTYQLGAHQLGVGIDNLTYHAIDQGATMTGPGYAWIYSHAADPNKPINTGLGVPAPGGDGYYAQRYIYSVETSMSTKQKAYYLQDVWAVTNNFQLNLGIRNDHFTNYNDLGIAFVNEKNQWEPRLGFSWDVNGNSTFKIYGNAGRYYLALPDSVAERAANRSTYTRTYFHYDGVDANGVPQNLSQFGPVTSADNEYGQPKGATEVAATNLKAQYQDEFILGFDKALGDKWDYGAKATYRELKTAIDDVCDVGRIGDKLTSMGLDASLYSYDDPGCRLFNPGSTNDFAVRKLDGTGYADVTMSEADWGFTQGAKRKYYSLDLYMEHPFDGVWQGRIDYTFARSFGNTEGQVKSDIGQTDVSKTQDWDSAELMENSYGLLSNDRRHSLRFRGAYQITPEWLVSGTVLIQSGTPKECLGFYGTADDDPLGYGSSYHWCGGVPSAPGATGSTPWTKKLDLGLTYAPGFADHKLAFNLNIYNVLNEQKGTQIDPVFEAGPGTISTTYNSPLFYEAPRFMRLSVSYDY